MLCLVPILLLLPLVSPNRVAPQTDERQGLLRPEVTLPARPELSPIDREEAERLAELRKEAERRFLESGDRADLDEALQAARAELDLRKRKQSLEGVTEGVPDGVNDEWWEVTEARCGVETVQRMATWSADEVRTAGELRDIEARVVEAFQVRDYPTMLTEATAAVELRERLFGSDAPTLATALENQSEAETELGRASEGVASLEAALEIHLASRGRRHPSTLDVERRIAEELHGLGQTREARDRLEQLLPPLRAAVGDGDKRALRALHLYGEFLAKSGQVTEAVEVFRHVERSARDSLGRGSFYMHNAQKLLADMLARLGELDEAEAILRELVSNLESLGPSRIRDALVARWTLYDFRVTHYGREHSSLEYTADLAADAARALGEDDPRALGMAVAHGQSLLTAGRPVEAIPFLRPAVEAGPRMASAVDGNLLRRMRLDLAQALNLAGRPEEAEGLVRETLADFRAERGPSDSSTLEALDQLASCQFDLGRIDEAVRSRRLAWELSVGALGASHRRSLSRQRFLASTLARQGYLMQRDGQPSDAVVAESIELARGAAKIGSEHLGSNHPDTLESRRVLARCLLRGRRFEESTPLVSQLVDDASQVHGHDSIAAIRIRSLYARSLMLLGDYAKARETIESCLTYDREELPRDRAALSFLSGEIDYRQGKLDEALVAYEQARTLAAALRRSVDADLAARAGSDERNAAHAIGTTLAAIHARRGEPHLAWQALEEMLGQPMLESLQPHDTTPREEVETYLDPERLHAGLTTGERLVAVLWSTERIVVASLDGSAPYEEAARASVIAEGFEPVLELAGLVARITEWLRTPNVEARPAREAKRLVESLFDAELRDTLASAERIVFVPSGPLATVPLAALAQLSGSLPDSTPVVYASSGSLYLDRREAGSTPSNPRLVALGDPLFERSGAAAPATPSEGLVLTNVLAGGAAEQAGLEVGDVLLAYADVSLHGTTDLLRAINTAGADGSTEKVPVRTWREGRILDTTINPGSMGVFVDRTHSPTDALRRLRSSQLPVEERNELATREARRTRMGPLAPLPGTRVEVQGIAALAEQAGISSRVLLGSKATREELERSLEGIGWLHLATHGRAGSREHPYDAGLALTPSDDPSGSDSILSLERLLNEWTTQLQGCELVVLSACETQRGARRGASSLALPLGFFNAGASTVVASLWKVDDRATSLLMRRFYANLFDPPGDRLGKLKALSEAQGWLNRLSWEEAEQLARADSEEDSAVAERGLGISTSNDHDPTGRPFEHPYYWAGFVLLGNPE